MKYRVTAWRHDISEHTVGEFDKNTNEEARVVFEKQYKNNPDYGFDLLILYRIDQEEKVTRLYEK